jgi:hypothetical protein
MCSILITVVTKSTPTVAPNTITGYQLVMAIVTDFINALPGNSSVTTVQEETIKEAVFCISDRRANRLAE